jgi:CheY-like chemotaxis protein
MLYKNILLIDDDADDAEIFMEAVNAVEKGIAFRSEANPVKALEELEVSEKLPDIIFLDYNMPLLNGKEFLQRIKSKNKLKDIPVILISSPSEEFVTDLLQKNEIIHYISKPNSYAELIQMLKDVLKLP